MKSTPGRPIRSALLTSAMDAAVDAYRERLQREHPGIPVSRSDAMRELLVMGMSAVGLAAAAVASSAK